MASLRTPPTITALVLAACTGASAEVGSDTATTSAASTSTTGETGGTTTDTSGSTSSTTADDSTTTGTTGTGTTTTSTGDSESSSTTGEGSTSTTGGDTDDLDCLAAPDNDPSAPWSRRFKTEPYEAVRWPSVEVDAAGSVILGAHFIGAIDLGAGPIPEDEEAVGRWRVFLAKYDGPCALAWDVVISGDGEIQDLAFTPDADGGVIAAGSFFGTLDFGGTTLEATYGIEAVADVLYQTTDLFVARYSPEGALLWARRFGDDAYQRAHDVAITDADEVIVVGGVRGTVDLGNDVIVADERYDGLLAQFTANGEHAWHHTFSAPADVGIFAVDVSAGGLLSISGLAASGVDFGGGPLDVVDETYEYLAQFEPSGEHRWSRRNLPGYEPHGLLADDDGAVYSAGTTKYVQDTPRDAFVIRFDDAGELAWSRESATDGRAEGSDVALAPGGGVELAGFFEGTIDLGGGPATAANFATDLFYARVTPKGDVSATTQLGVESYAEVRPRAHRIGPAGQRVTVGTFTGTVDFGAGPMTSGDEGEVFLRVAP